MSPPSCHLFPLAQGLDACFETNNVNIGTSSCHGRKACFGVEDSTIDNDSCHGASACSIMEDSTVGNESCLGTQPCDGVKNSVIGKGSCTDSYSCEDIENITIGNNSCNGDDVCYKCKHNVPDNACNQGITADMTTDGYCRYCGRKPGGYYDWHTGNGISIPIVPPKKK